MVDKPYNLRRDIGFGQAQLSYGTVVSAQDWTMASVEAAYRRHHSRLSASGEVLALGDIKLRANRGGCDQPLKRNLPPR